MKKIVSFALVIALALTALSSCDGEIPQKAYNDIPDFEVVINPPTPGRSSGKYDSIRVKLRENSDLYDSVSVKIEGNGFDYNIGSDYEYITHDKINHDVRQFGKQCNFYEIYKDDDKIEEYYEYSVRYSIEKREMVRGSGYISFTFVAIAKSGEEYTAKYYVYYACDGEYVAYSNASVLAARRALESIMVVY